MSSLEQVHHQSLKLPVAAGHPQQQQHCSSLKSNQVSPSSYHHNNIHHPNNTSTPPNNNTATGNNNINPHSNTPHPSYTKSNNVGSHNMMNNVHHHQQQPPIHSVSNKANLDNNERMFHSYSDEDGSNSQYHQSFDFQNTMPNGGGLKPSNSHSNNNFQKQHHQNMNLNPMLSSSPNRMNQSPMMKSNGTNMMNNANNNYHSSGTMEKNIPNVGSIQHSHSPDNQFYNQGTFSPQKTSQPMNVDNFKVSQNQMFYNQSPQNAQHLFQQNMPSNKNNQISMGDFASHVNNIPNLSNSPQTLNSKESLYQSFPTALHQYNYNAQAQQSKTTATPVVEVISNLFKGFEFCLSGKFTLIQRKFETLILQHGGSVQKSINAVVTHLISTQDELLQEEKAVKVTKAIARNIPIITEDFIQDSIKQNNLQDVKNYVLAIPKDQKKENKTPIVDIIQPVESQDNDKKRKPLDDARHHVQEDVKRQKHFDMNQAINKNQ